MAKHSSNVYTVLLLAAFLALAGVTALLFYKGNELGLTTPQKFGLEPGPTPGGPTKAAPGAPAGTSGSARLPRILDTDMPRSADIGDALTPVIPPAA